MSALADYYNGFMNSRPWEYFGAIGAIKGLYGAYEGLYNNAHGGDRYKLSQIPGFGTWKRFEDKAQWYQDYYDTNGHDPNYASDYGNNGIPGVSDVARGFTPVRMARQLARMYGCEVELNIQRARSSAYSRSREAADAWARYESLRQNRRN